MSKNTDINTLSKGDKNMIKEEESMTQEEIEAKNKFLKDYGYMVGENGETVRMPQKLDEPDFITVR